MANPLPMALVVLPTESSASVVLLTSDPKPAISAIPLALSTIGPKASIATMMPVMDCIPTVAMAMPYTPANLCARKIAPQMTTMGRAVPLIPIAKPARIVVADPV